jgi:hypothetical protein
MSFGKAIAIAGGIAVGAFGAYNYSTTGCPLGTGCGTDDAAATATPVVQTVAEDEACPLGCSMDSDAKTLAVAGDAGSCEAASSCCSEGSEAVELVAAEGASCCSSMNKGAAVLAVSETTEAAGSCCSAESAETAEVALVAEKAEDCCGQCGDDNAECDPAECTAGDACCKAVASKDD